MPYPLATLALWVRFGLSNVRGLTESKRLLLAAIVMGFAISGMHYTGMEAARFVGHPLANAGVPSEMMKRRPLQPLAVICRRRRAR